MNVNRKYVIHASIAAFNSADEHARIAGSTLAGCYAYPSGPSITRFEDDHLRACHADRLESDQLYREFKAMAS